MDSLENSKKIIIDIIHQKIRDSKLFKKIYTEIRKAKSKEEILDIVENYLDDSSEEESSEEEYYVDDGEFSSEKSDDC